MPALLLHSTPCCVKTLATYLAHRLWCPLRMADSFHIHVQAAQEALSWYEFAVRCPYSVVGLSSHACPLCTATVSTNGTPLRSSTLAIFWATVDL